MRIGIAGSGFAGAVLAHELANTGRFEIEVFEERSHIAGNCYTERDRRTGILIHSYGPHIFNTSREDVWQFVNRFGEFVPFTNRVKAVTQRGVFSLPINLLTINQFFGKRMNPREAEAFVASLGDQSIAEPRNFEEQALKMMGRDLYQAFFYGYTKKQWGVEPTELPASILRRLPIRYTYDDNYYNQRYQGIPKDGYTPMITKLLDHPAIKLHLNHRLVRSQFKSFDHVFYSGPLDELYDYEFGRLGYRSLEFERFTGEGDYQGNPVINYCESSVPFTRITEHKHFTPWESHSQTICFREKSKTPGPDDILYYPMRLDLDKERLGSYVDRANRETHLTFIGRLATYRYLDMHVVIGESLDLARVCLLGDHDRWPRFSGPPL